MASKPNSEPGSHANDDQVTAPVPIDDQSPVGEVPPEEHRGNLPVHVVRLGMVKATIWLNHTDYGPVHNVTVARIYKGSDDMWYSSTSFGFCDLLTLAKCLDLAHSYIASQASRNNDVPF